MDIKIEVGTTGYELNIDLPELEGSEKQVSWADSLRVSRIEEINKVIKQASKQMGVDYSICNPQRDDISDLKDGAEKIQVALQTQMAVIEKIFSQVDSKFWIENRGADMSALAKKSQ